MKSILVIISLLLASACSGEKNKVYTGSTPAGIEVRHFLGIPLSDSVDFIRWNLSVNNHHYTINCNYGIGKPNTNGFINGGKKIHLNDRLKNEKYILLLQNKNRRIKIAVLNNSLLHFINDDNSLLIGNGGWSYTLNKLVPLLSDQLNLRASPAVFKDSISFEGRTPCGVPEISKPGNICYKLKWRITLYEPTVKNETGIFFMNGTAWYEQGGKKGKWEMITGREGRIFYKLTDEKQIPIIHLLKLDDGVLIFTDKNGNLLVGDPDFSYTLNRIRG